MAVLANAVAADATGSSSSADTATLIEKFIDAWDRQDIDAVFGACAPDIVYGNGPLKDIVGLSALRDYFTPVLKAASKIEFRVSKLVAAGAIASVERVDYITLGNTTFEVPVAGFLTINDNGKICEWRDYFDTQAWYDQGGPPLESAADKS